MLKDIRKLCYDAERDEILKMDKNPFRRYKLVTEYSEKSFLTEDELQKVADLVIDPRKMKYHSRNMYVFACYTGGIRISDLLQLRFNNYDGERLLIKTQKTDSMLSILVPDIARKIIDLYINDNTQANDYIFPFLKKEIDYSDPEVFYKAISSANAFINSHLKEIAKTLKFDKKMNFHTSRHTFATRALRKGMRIEYVSRLMTHTNITTTQIYAKIVNAELDTAMNIFNQ
jgi:integrase